MRSPGPTDLHRWFLYDCEGLSIDAIADLQNMDALVVQASIDYIKEWKFRNQMSLLNVKFVSIAMDNMDGINQQWKLGLKADKVIHVDRETGKIKKAPDTAMRLKTIDSIRNFVDTVTPKAPLVQNNTQFNNGQSSGGGSSISFEAILRKKREQRGMLNSQDAEILHEELTAEEAIADEFKDFGGSDEDEEDEEDE